MTFLTAGTFNFDGTTVLIDFEASDPMAANNFEGETSYYNVHTASPLESSQSVEGASDLDWIASTDFPTPRTDSNGNPIERRMATEVGSSGTMTPRICVQDPSAYAGGRDDDYYAILEGDGDFKLQRKDSSNSDFSTELARASSDVPNSEGDEFVIGLETTETDITAKLYEHSGSGVAGDLLRGITVSDTTHSGGYFGVGTGDGTGALADLVVEEIK
jgi:hypothetical protein